MTPDLGGCGCVPWKLLAAAIMFIHSDKTEAVGITLSAMEPPTDTFSFVRKYYSRHD